MKNRTKLLLLLSALIIAVILGISKGSVSIPFVELFQRQNSAILQLRLSRIVVGILVGAGLGISGVIFQALLRNPLAEPYVLGVSSGAGLGAVIGMLFGASGIPIQICAFLGAVLSIALVYTLAREGSKIPIQSLTLLGVTVAVLFSGIIVFLVSISSNESMYGIMWWLLGSLAVFNLNAMIFVAFAVIIGSVTAYFYSRELNAISLGEEEAVHLGIEVETTKKILFVLSSLITASIVCVAGIIPFVGLIIPHMVRLLVGPNHAILIPASAIVGAMFLILCDIISRSAVPPLEIPIGIITSLIGGAIFIVLMRQTRKVK